MSDNFLTENPVNPSNKLSIRDYLSTVFKYKWSGIFVFIIANLICILFVLFKEDLYKSESRIFVTLGWENMNKDPLDRTGDENRGGQPTQSVLLKSMIEVIKGRALCEEVVNRVGIDSFFSTPSVSNNLDLSFLSDLKRTVKDYISKTKNTFNNVENLSTVQKKLFAINAVMNFTEANVIRNTQIISISFTSPLRSLSQKVVNELTYLFEIQHKKVYRKEGSLDFLLKHKNDLLDEIDFKEEAITKLKKCNEYTNPDNRLLLIENDISSVKNLILDTESDIITTKAKIKNINNAISTQPKETIETTTTTDNSIIIFLRQKKYELLSTRHELTSKYTEDSEPVTIIDDQINKIDKDLSEYTPSEFVDTTKSLNSTYFVLESDLISNKTLLTALEAKYELLTNRLQNLKIDFNSIIDNNLFFTRMERDLVHLNKNYDEIVSKLNQAYLEEDLEINSISNLMIVQPATLPINPIDSKKLIILIGGFLGGLVAAIAVTFIRSSLDNTFSKPSDFDNKLDLKLLVAIPKYKPNNKAKHVPLTMASDKHDELVKAKQ